MPNSYKTRRLVAMLVTVIMTFSAAGLLTSGPPSLEQSYVQVKAYIAELLDGQPASNPSGEAWQALESLPVKGKAPKTGYQRSQFGQGWSDVAGCDQRNNILRRDLVQVELDSECRVVSGVLHDPYTGQSIDFKRGSGTSAEVQIDHVVALSNAWQTGAQQLSLKRRSQLANDPLELIAVDGAANQQKSAGDAATWLPANKSFRCQYVARQIAVKVKYSLWVTSAEKQAIKRVLSQCPNQKLPVK